MNDLKNVPIGAITLIVIGVIFVIKNYLGINILSYLRMDLVWPVLIILLGVYSISKRNK